MTLNRAHAGLGSGYLTEEPKVEQLSELAHDFDRWGLGPEAEVARLRFRRSVVKQLLNSGSGPAGLRTARHGSRS